MTRYGVVIEVTVVVGADDLDAADAEAYEVVNNAIQQGGAPGEIENIEVAYVAERVTGRRRSG